MNILIIGSGGREHALAWKIVQSPKCNRLFVAPGNAGTSSIATNVNIGVSDFEGLATHCLSNEVSMIIVGPEVPLVEGVRDYFIGRTDLKHISVIGPDKVGAQLEGSKDFSKDFMKKHDIPTAKSKTFTKDTLQEGLEYLKGQPLPIVLKADGLAAGKGVVIAESLEVAESTLTDMLANALFGDASSKVLIEDFLTGIELSVFVLTDGKGGYVILPEAKDYKRIGEGDTGPNTGGMGAISPVPFADATFMANVENMVIKPTINGLLADGVDFVGFLFIGLMNDNGQPNVIEYNVRMGDPETEVVIPRIKTDLVDVFQAAANGTLSEMKLDIDERTATTVMMVSEGYPGNYEKGRQIIGADETTESLIFHAGTVNVDGKVLTNGGRVIAVTTLGEDISSALKKTYSTVSDIKWEGVNFRTDIGQDLLKLTN
jgi:phosphoribosylamine--glycine ligase